MNECTGATKSDFNAKKYQIIVRYTMWFIVKVVNRLQVNNVINSFMPCNNHNINYHVYNGGSDYVTTS